MVILHIAPINMTSTNGFRFSVPGLVSSQNNIPGIQSGLMTIRDSRVLIDSEVEKFDFDFLKYKKSISKLRKPYNKPEIVVFHGVYQKKYISLYYELKKKKIPYIVVPRVSLTKGAQNQKRLKKMIGNLLFYRKFVYNAKSIQFLTENEKIESDMYNKKDFFIVGNGIRIPSEKEKNKRKSFNLTYMGRYDINHKGLDILIEAINLGKDSFEENNIYFNLYGSDLKRGKDYLKSKINSYKLNRIVTVNGPIFNEEKARILRSTDLFIAPSRFEGHPMAVIEAMAYGVPCIISKGTNMLDVLLRYKAGWKIELDPNDIFSVINRVHTNKELLFKVGGNAKRLAQDNYSWEKIAMETTFYYKKILKNCPLET